MLCHVKLGFFPNSLPYLIFSLSRFCLSDRLLNFLSLTFNSSLKKPVFNDSCGVGYHLFRLYAHFNQSLPGDFYV